MRLFGNILLISISIISLAQNSTLRARKIAPHTTEIILIDSNLVVENSVYFKLYTEGKDYELRDNYLTWLSPQPSDSIDMYYRIADFQVSYTKKNTTIIQESFQDNPFRYIPDKTETAANYGTINTMGNVSRGIGLGNAQDIVVNSNLNLRLNGVLANDVDVLAVISDENNPIQPEGNTQQIQDFDQVFITLKKDSGTLTIGDFMMQRPQESYFINYYKKSRGLQFQNVKHSKDWRIGYGGEVAISRGRFSRNRIDGIEGNSGPYRLSGSNGEIFIVVIAGTENVYLDGKKLTRGEDHDYVINYNTGEITFTPRILITRYSRVVVEFQYSDRNYARSVSRMGTSLSKGKLTIYTNFFNEMDLRSQSFQQNLDGFDSTQMKSAFEILGEAGDNLAFFNNIRQQQSYNSERIMYKKGIVNGNEAYIYADNPSEIITFYEIRFTNVGFGNGTYRQAQTAANGKVFEYVGDGLGDYLPIEILIAPQRLNNFNIGVVRSDEKTSSGVELVLSGYDKNTISPLDDADNGGYGLRTFRNRNQKLKDSTWTYISDMNYELVSARYNYVERYRDVEFDRKWNKVIANPNAFSQFIPDFEHIGNASFGLEKNANRYIHNGTSVFVRPSSFSGISNTTKGGFEVAKFRVKSQLELLQSNTEQDSSTTQNQFYSFNGNIQRGFRNISTGLNYANEKSQFLLNDSLGRNSYGFDATNLFLNSNSDGRFKYALNAGQRNDNLPKNEGFSLATIGRDVTINSSYSGEKSNRIELNTTYRQLSIRDSAISNRPLENTLQSRVEADFFAFKKFVRSRTFYQIGTGQEQRREFQYLQVQPGNGVYIWNDYDSNGIKTLNEFEVASDLDRQRADYIKIFTPVAGFFTTNTNKISQSLELNPIVFYKDIGVKKPFFARFNSLSSLILDKKILPTDIIGLLNPFQTDISDTALISNSQNFRTTLFYNRGNPIYSIDYSYIDNTSKVLLTNGFDSRKSQDNVVNARINLGKRFSLNTRIVAGERLYESQFFSTRSFDYSFYEIEPKLQYVSNNTYRIEIRSKFYRATNGVEFGGESSENVELGSEFKYTKSGKGSLQTGATYIKVNFDGEPSSTLGYELLRGLQNGNNATWNFSYQQTLSNSIQLTVSYDGRKSEDAPVIHIGRLVARYLF